MPRAGEASGFPGAPRPGAISRALPSPSAQQQCPPSGRAPTAPPAPRRPGAGRAVPRSPARASSPGRGAPLPESCPREGGDSSIRCSRGQRPGQARPPAAACALSGCAGPALGNWEEPGEQRASPGISSPSGRERKCGAGGDGAQRSGLSAGLAVVFARLQLPPAAPLPAHARRQGPSALHPQPVPGPRRRPVPGDRSACGGAARTLLPGRTRTPGLCRLTYD
ncbi:uncharacterized protein LOC143694395 [Agelaius phoeniceus]|uniref:uncharacterized protein LOC143694395 n=1 Tax=Agelaius phoeniceus TaxID=39638 RepID=UPI00405508A0